MKTRVAARVVGRVQGVGFRPTVYRYAREFGLGGFVCNEPQGVTIEVEGEEERVAAFFHHLTTHPPKQAVIANIETNQLPEKGYRFFSVVQTRREGDFVVEMPPDLATCDDCARELLDPANRRHRHPFINCTNCGPRFTIIRDLPYDRDQTAMSGFAMCPDCRQEYETASDRRFHDQPNACPQCGPQLSLVIPGGSATQESVIAKVVNLIQRGQVVAIKGLGGYHLACDPLSNEAVTRLRERKHRHGKPLAVMFRDLATLRQYCEVSEVEEAELLSAARPVVVLRRHPVGESIPAKSRLETAPTTTANQQDPVGGDLLRMSRRLGFIPDRSRPTTAPTALAGNVAPDTQTVGAFLPYSPVHHLLMQHFDALVMTSGNLTDDPIISDESELAELLGPIADAALAHDRPIIHKCDDSVLRVINGQRQFLRRARGYVPNPLRFALRSPHLLAVGGELKNTFCLARDGQAFLSQHLGDLKDYRTHELFTREIAEGRRVLRIEPTVIAHDLHPGYLSTRYAREQQGVRLIGVQHHHAHIASVMAEHNLRTPVIGVALDGTGYGTDGTIWGGEFLMADRAEFERAAHFKPYPLPGGDKAITEPWRMAVGALHAEGIPCRGYRAQMVEQQIAIGFNAPLTSSAGRLFDAVASLLGLCNQVSYEAQAAIRLEAAADLAVHDHYPYAIETRWRPWTVDFGLTLRALLEERERRVPVGTIAARFHNTVAAATVKVCRYLRGQQHCNTVALSGGVFQNDLLLRRVIESLQAHHFRVFTNTFVPPNDGGLALGQVAVAAARLRAEEVAD